MQNLEKLHCSAGIWKAIVMVAVLLNIGNPGINGLAQEKKGPAVKKIGETRYRLGMIEFDAKSREVSVPVVVNKREGGPMEYLLIHESGKVHESVLTTKASPLSLQIILKLLKYKAGAGDVFGSLLPESAKKAGNAKEEDRGDSVTVKIRWAATDEVGMATELILDGKDSTPMSKGHWTYTGSKIENGKYMAELEGSFIAIYLDELAIFNMEREGADNDERWGANPEAIPEIGTRGTLILRLSKATTE